MFGGKGLELGNFLLCRLFKEKGFGLVYKSSFISLFPDYKPGFHDEWLVILYIVSEFSPLSLWTPLKNATDFGMNSLVWLGFMAIGSSSASVTSEDTCTGKLIYWNFWSQILAGKKYRKWIYFLKFWAWSGLFFIFFLIEGDILKV